MKTNHQRKKGLTVVCLDSEVCGIYSRPYLEHIAALAEECIFIGTDQGITPDRSIDDGLLHTIILPSGSPDTALANTVTQAIHKASGEWILILKAGEFVPADDKSRIADLCRHTDQQSYYVISERHLQADDLMPYEWMGSLGKYGNNKVLKAAYVPRIEIRLFRKGAFKDLTIEENHALHVNFIIDPPEIPLTKVKLQAFDVEGISSSLPVSDEQTWQEDRENFLKSYPDPLKSYEDKEDFHFFAPEILGFCLLEDQHFPSLIEGLSLGFGRIELLKYMVHKLITMGQYDRAIDFAETLQHQLGHHVELWKLIGSAHFYHLNFEEADRCYREALAIEPCDADIIANLARVSIILNRFDQASSFLQQVMTITGITPEYEFLARSIKENKGRKATLSLLMLARDEESCIAAALDSVRGVVDEMLLIDTGSTDRTVEIAESYGARILRCPWKDDFSEARNAGLAELTGDYVLILDADEYFEPEAKMALTVFKNALPIERRIAVVLDIKSYAGEDPRNKEMALRSAGRRTAIVPLDRKIHFSGRIFEQMDQDINKLHLERINTTNIHIVHRNDRRAFRRQRNEAALRRSFHDTLRPEDIFQGILFWMDSNRPDDAFLWFRRALFDVPYDRRYGTVMADFTSYLDACGKLEKDATILPTLLEKYSRCYRIMTLCCAILIRRGRPEMASPVLGALAFPLEGNFDDPVSRKDLRNNQFNLALIAIERVDLDLFHSLLEALSSDEDWFDTCMALRFFKSIRQGDIELAVAHLDEVIRKRNLPIEKTLQDLIDFMEVAAEVAELMIGYGQWQAGNILIRSLEHLAGILDTKKGLPHAETAVR